MSRRRLSTGVCRKDRAPRFDVVFDFKWMYEANRGSYTVADVCRRVPAPTQGQGQIGTVEKVAAQLEEEDKRQARKGRKENKTGRSAQNPSK